MTKSKQPKQSREPTQTPKNQKPQAAKPAAQNKRGAAGNGGSRNTSARASTPSETINAKFPHFRRYKKNNHPALITGEHSEDEYKFRKVMHSEKDGRHLNEKVEPNPDPTDKAPMYIGKRVRHDKKKYFGKRLPWKYPKKNKKK